MTENSATPSIVVCYYDMQEIEKDNPIQLAKRCCGEIVSLCDQLRLTTQHLISAAKRTHLTDAVRLCEYYYEYAIAKIYSLRERAWDALSALVSVPRKSTGNKQFRQRVQSKLGTDYQELESLFESFLATISSDINNRNIATHNTVFFLGVTLTHDFHDTYEIDSVLLWHDPESSTGKMIEANIRRALNDFVRQEVERFQQAINQALEIRGLCVNAIREKLS